MAYYKIHVAVHLFLIKNDKILLLRRYNTGYEDGNYSVVAGHIRGNENVYKAMQREALEEAGIHIEVKDLHPVQVMNRKKTPSEQSEERIDYFFTANVWKGNISNMEPSKCDELKWFSIYDLPKNMVPYVKKAFEYFDANVAFTLFGWE